MHLCWMETTGPPSPNQNDEVVSAVEAPVDKPHSDGRPDVARTKRQARQWVDAGSLSDLCELPADPTLERDLRRFGR